MIVYYYKSLLLKLLRISQCTWARRVCTATALVAVCSLHENMLCSNYDLEILHLLCYYIYHCECSNVGCALFVKTAKAIPMVCSGNDIISLQIWSVHLYIICMLLCVVWRWSVSGFVYICACAHIDFIIMLVHGGYSCMNGYSDDLSLHKCINIYIHIFHTGSFVYTSQYLIYIVMAMISACSSVFIHVFASILVIIVRV